MRDLAFMLFFVSMLVNGDLIGQISDSLFHELKVNDEIYIRNYMSDPSLIIKKDIDTVSFDTLYIGNQNDTLVQFKANDSLITIMMVSYKLCSFPILKKINGKWNLVKIASGLSIENDPPGYLPPGYIFRKYSNFNLLDFDRFSGHVDSTGETLPSPVKHLILYQIDLVGFGINILSITKID